MQLVKPLRAQENGNLTLRVGKRRVSRLALRAAATGTAEGGDEENEGDEAEDDREHGPAERGDGGPYPTARR